MSDVATAEAPQVKKYIVPITKAKTTLEVDVSNIPDEVWDEVVLQGLKAVLNRGMSKITAKDTKDAEEMKRLALEAGQKNLNDLFEGKTKITGQKKAKAASGAVMTEARRLAKAIVKDECKKAGLKVSHIPAKQITEAANALLEARPDLVEQAKANLEERAKAKVPEGFNIKSLLHEDPKLAAKAEARAKVGKGQQSAKQAGMVKAKAKGEAAHATH